MNEPQSNPFGITREEILDLAAQKLANEFADQESLENRISKLINQKVEEASKSRIIPAVDAALKAEMDTLLNKEIVPIDIWGQKAGEPTTVRAAFIEHARNYWDAKVDNEGKPSTYYQAKPRHQYFFEKIAGEQFSKAVEQNIVNLVGAFKDSLKADVAAQMSNHIDTLIKVKTK